MISRRWVRAWLAVAAAWTVSVPLASAQPQPRPVHRDCLPDSVRRRTLEQVPADLRRFWPATRLDRWAAPMADGRWREVVDTLSAGLAPAGQSPALDRLRARLAGLDRALVQAEADGHRDRTRGVLVSPNAFDIQTRGAGVILFEGDPDEIVVDETMPAATRCELCWTAIAAERVLHAYSEPAFRAAAQTLHERRQRWDNFNRKGYSMLPWELVLNDRFLRFVDAKTGEPPGRQVVFLHPSVGVEMAGDRWDELSRLDVAVLEPIGVLWYTKSRASYFGISSAVSAPTDASVGFGPFVHLGRAAKLGYVFRRHRSGQPRRNGMLVSVDLYGLLTDAPETLKARAAEAMKLLAGKARATLESPGAP